jgi:hypothetical protein
MKREAANEKLKMKGTHGFMNHDESSTFAE